MSTSQSSAFGALLRRQRLAAGLTQEALAERAGLSVRGLSDLERGVSALPRLESVALLAEALDLQDADRAAFVAAARPELAVPSSPTAHAPALPGQPTPLLGRGLEIELLSDLLLRDDVRLVTLVGPGGIGKTRLGLAVAAALRTRFGDGACFVPLAALRDPALIPSAIAGVLDIQETAARPLLESVMSALRRKHLLLLLDNFEHLTAGAPLVGELLAACERLKILVTSRAVLRLRGEQEFPVPPLALPERDAISSPDALMAYPAIQLFVQRAQAALPAFTLTAANAQAVAAICARLDGLPLAIELAAARSKLLSPRDLLERLEHRLQVLTGGARDLPERQRTLRATLAWSYDLLGPGEQTLFRRLAVFAGGCTMAAAEAVCNAAGDLPLDILDGLATLLDQSLLQRREEDDGTRLVMLETVREYGLELLEAGAELDALRRRHAEYFLRLAEEIEPALTAGDRLVRQRELEREHDNLRAALAWSLDAPERREIGLLLAGALWRFWDEWGHLREAREWFTRLLAPTSTPVSRRARARALYGAGSLLLWQGEQDAGYRLLAESVALWRRQDDRRGLAFALHALGRAVMGKGDRAQALALQEEAVALARDLGVAEVGVWLSWALHTLGEVYLRGGQFGPARARMEEALAISRLLDSAEDVLFLICYLAHGARLEGDVARARALYEEATALVRSQEEQWQRLHVLAFAAYYQEAYATAIALFERARREAEAEGQFQVVAWHLNHMGDVARAAGEWERATALYEESAVRFRALEWKQGIAAVQHNQADVALAQGRTEEAAARLRDALQRFKELGFSWSIADCLAGFAGVAAATGLPERAARLFGAAEALHQRIDLSGALMEPANRLAWERNVAAARGQIDASRWDAAWEEGGAMSEDQAVAYALDDVQM